MNIKTLTLNNFRCFEQAEFEFDERITLVIGDNTKGKTTILEGLSVAMGGFLLGVPNSYAGDTKKAFIRNLHKRDIQRYFLTSREVVTTEFRENCQVEASGSVGKHSSINWSRLLKKVGGKPVNSGCEKIRAEATRLYESQKSEDVAESENLPVLVHYGTGRLWAGQKTTLNNQLKDANTAFGYYYSLKPDAQNKTLMPWLEKMDRIAYQQRSQPPLILEAVLDAIQQMIPGATGCYYSPEYAELAVEFGHKVFPYSDLSDGQRNIITLAGDLAMRCAHLNQHLGKEAARKTPGIVLVDEIDANIHPSWQRELLSKLLGYFGNIQFVVTSHSPFILQSLDHGKIINLDHLANPEQDADLWDRGIEDIVTEVMGVDTRRSEQYQRMLTVAQQYYRLLDEGAATDSAEVTELASQLDAFEAEFSRHPAYVAMLRAGRNLQGID